MGTLICVALTLVLLVGIVLGGLEALAWVEAWENKRTAARDY